MAKMKTVLWSVAFLVILLPMCLRAERIFYLSRPIAHLTAGSAGLEWLPLVNHGRLILTVAGPFNLVFRKEFDAGQNPTLGFFDSEGNRLPDGSYTWELRVIPLWQGDAQEEKRDPGDSSQPLVQSGYFSIRNGNLGLLGPSGGAGPVSPRRPVRSLTNEATTTDSLTVKGNACIGGECVIYSNGVDTDAVYPVLKLKGPNLGILFNDVEIPNTSSTFRNWAVQANPDDADRFSLVDVDNATLPFSVEGAAPGNALYVRSNGHLGLGTSTPSQDVHVISSNSPAIRLEQDGTGGPTARTWDAVGNDIGFFVRDVSNSSAVPFRIQAGAPTSSLEVSGTGYVGVGTSAPSAPLHVYAGVSNDIYVGLGPTPTSGAAAFTIGYGGLSFGRASGFFNVRPDASAAAPNPSLRFLTGDTQRMIIDNEGFVGLGAIANPAYPIHHASGAHLTVGGVWTNASSRSVKHDIQELDAEAARTALSGLAPVRFRYNSDPGEESLGFISEDVPDLVGTSDRKSLSPMDVVAVLTKVVQEQERMIYDLASTVKELRARIEEIEGDR